MNKKKIEIGDIIETRYGTMKVVDIERSYYDEYTSYIETRVINND